MEKVKIVEVVWLDTCHASGEGICRHEVAELRPPTFHSYGILAEDTDKYITVVSGVLEHELPTDTRETEYRDVVCIPKGAVQSIRELK